jgi:F0F1-type ATP synthase membrane subunit b/b'
MELFYNSHFWALIALIITVSLSFKKIYALANSFLETKIFNIKKEIKDSEDTLAEALALLNERKKALNTVIEDSENQIISSKMQLETKYEQALYDINHSNNLIKNNLQNYFNQQSNKVVHSLKEELVNYAINSISYTTKTSLNTEHHYNLIEDSISNINNSIKQ